MKPESALPAFPYLGGALIALAAFGVMGVLVPPNPIRSVVGLVALFAVGYLSLAVVVGRSIPLSVAETLAFSTGLAVLAGGASALLAASLHLPIGGVSVLLLGVPIGALAWARHRPVRLSVGGLKPGLVALLALPSYSRRERGIARVLFVAIVVALLILVSLAFVPYPGELSPGIAIVGPDGTPGSLPTSFIRNEAQEIHVTVFAGSMDGTFTLRVRLAPANASGNEVYHAVPWTSPQRLDLLAQADTVVSVRARESWQEPMSLAIDGAGSFSLTFDLLDGGLSPLASLKLPISVTG